MQNMHEAVLYQKQANQNVQCTACSWHCKIAPSQTGICGIRKNVNGKLYLLAYGKAIAAHIDPIEKKPLFHFLPGTRIFSIGTLGCNFACSFCQNWDISQAIREQKKTSNNSTTTPNPIPELGSDWLPNKIVAHCTAHNIPSVAFTYNEPIIFFEYAYDTMTLGKKHGLKSAFVSNGYESKQALAKLNGKLDAINIDLKSFSEKFYHQTCKAKLEPVLQTIEHVAKSKIWLEITTLIIPKQNDSDTELTQIAEFIAAQSPNIPWHISAFHPDYHMRSTTTTPRETLQRAYEIGKKAGLKYIYVGNIADAKRSSTHCPQCHHTVIQRNYYEVTGIHLQNNACTHCNHKIPGVWS